MKTLSIYNQHAEAYAKNWERVGSNAVSLYVHIFEKGSSLLEIGSGSGRDLAYLHSLGIDVYGIEPCENLISEAERLHPELKGRVFLGGLPDEMPSLPYETYDGILLSAVLMHIPDENLFQSAYAIRDRLKIGGKLVISVPLRRDDMGASEQRDNVGRLMILRPIGRIKLLFERIGFESTNTFESADALCRSGFLWATIVFTYLGGSISKSVDKIECIINRDRKTTTYKFALLKALCDIAQNETGSVVWDNMGCVHVSVDSVVRKWIEYYWPLVSSDEFIPQTRGEHEEYEKPISFRRSLDDLSKLYRNHGGLSQFVFDRDRNAFISSVQDILKIVKSKVRQAIIQGPVTYSGGGKSDDKPFSYDTNTRSIVFDADIYREFALLGHWIRDSINIRWADLTVHMGRHDLELADVLQLLLYTPHVGRNVGEAKKVYEELKYLECVWSAKKIKRDFDVDHAIPFVLRHDNSLWNLFPANAAINNQKKDKLPTKSLLTKRRDLFVYYWENMYDQLPELFRSDYLRFTGQKALNSDNWQNVLFWNFTEAVESTAMLRGVERWEP